MADDTMPPDAAAQIIRARAAVDPNYVARLFQIESGGNPNAVTGSNRGLGQFGPEEEARYGLNDQNRGDRAAQAAAVAREAEEHSAVLRRALGRDPTNGEMYLTHQQGVAGGPALLGADPNVPAWQAIRPYYKSDRMAKLAITGNVPYDHPLYRQDADNITAGDFRNLWVNKFERNGRGGTGPVPGAGGAPPAAASGVPAGAVAGPAAVGPSQTGAVPVDPAQAAGSDDQLLQMLQALSAPQQHDQAPALPPLTLNMPSAPGLQRARALALAMGKASIA